MDDITTKPEPLDPEGNPQVAYEHGDLNVVSVSKYAIALAFGVLIAASAMWGLFDYFNSTANQGEAVVSKAILAERPKLPPEPRLQPTPKLYVKELRESEETYLHSYGWINPNATDPSAGIARIPIAEAIQMIAKKGLPSRAVKADGGLDRDGYREIPATSSSGRTKEKIR